MTDAAFALADLPADVTEDLRPTLRAAVNSIIALVQPPAEEGVLIYLDCDPKVAAERLALRTGAPVSTEQVDFLVRMYESYEFLMTDRPEVVRVNANQEIHTVAAAVRAHVRL
jgi:thymidylate kinase